jgi:cytochrome c oxidase cbb3-type subunit III
MSSSTFPNASPDASESDPSARVEAKTHHTPQLLDHEYDGIKEYDNPMPGWWVATFWITFFFAIGYAFHYHVSPNGVSVADAYEADMAEARAAEAKRSLGEAVTEAGLQKLALDPGLMKDARAIFVQRCMPCHGEQGQGVIGPNLTDAYWLHGSTLMDIYKTVSEGVPQKGMPAWKMQLSAIQTRQLAAFVGSLTQHPVPGKAPEGELAGGAAH